MLVDASTYLSARVSLELETSVIVFGDDVTNIDDP
jgi:hypothetical protein